ncbi:hypothetical protein [Streptomyces sp. M92]|uniref:hypothetical protein n=1 Tax=Streptomyces sp. M92 TaxID=2944250 RepID=UPI00234BF564|nr:hypothetical protein [Streptomyces sp. M92]WCN03994.1 hypothetical protein M6G08_18805 [Streptomyces sp. M92]
MRPIARTGVAVCLATAAVVAWSASSSSAEPSPSVATTVADEAPGYAVEDFNYPGADRIQQEQGIVLKRGDGHIVLAECGSEEGLMELWVRYRAEHVCFRVTGDSGYLSVEIPAVYGIKGAANQSADVKMTVDDEESHYDVPAGTLTNVGETADPEGRDHMLLEITTSK